MKAREVFKLRIVALASPGRVLISDGHEQFTVAEVRLEDEIDGIVDDEDVIREAYDEWCRVAVAYN